jgi:RNA-binding protein 39
MFDPNGKDERTDPDFFTDLHEDVLEEGAKFGTVAEAKIVRESAGHVYLRFSDAQAAARAATSLHGRWFAGKQVLAEFVDEYAFAAAD